MIPTTEIDDHSSDAGSTDELQQVGVLPWRIRRDGEPKVMLITSRRRGRWIVPKGWTMKGRSLLVAASREAFEEAGIFGEIYPTPVTEYRYMKALDNGTEVPCRVTVFGMNVRGTLSHWREKAQRQRRWFSLGAAADKLGDAELAAFVRTLEAAPERLRPSDRLGGVNARPANRSLVQGELEPMFSTGLVACSRQRILILPYRRVSVER